MMTAVAILAVTLVPDTRAVKAGQLPRVESDRWQLADLLRNVILFAPLGATLAWSGLRDFRALVVGAGALRVHRADSTLHFGTLPQLDRLGLQHKSEAVFAAPCMRRNTSLNFFGRRTVRRQI
jgi:hypothetical protein